MHLVVVGGGVAGLAAAAEATRRGARVTVLEGSARVGGKVAVSEVGGLAVDEGADSMLTRVPDGIALARDAGLRLRRIFPIGEDLESVFSRLTASARGAGR